jgi:hypothetical protein
MQNGNRTEHPYSYENWNAAGNEYNVDATPSEHGDAPDHFEEFRAWSREQMKRYIEWIKHDPDISLELPPGDDYEPTRESRKPVVIESLASLSPEEQVAEFNRREEIKRRRQLVDEKWRRVVDDARAEFANQLHNQHDLIAEQSEKIEKYERKIARLEEELAAARRRANRTEEQVREEYDRQQREHAELQRKYSSPAIDSATGIRRPKRKPLNRVIFDVKATIQPDAAGTFEAIKKRHGPTKKLHVTHQLVEGQSLWMKMEYIVRGGHPSDIRRALDKCLAAASATLIGEPSIEVIERTQMEG